MYVYVYIYIYTYVYIYNTPRSYAPGDRDLSRGRPAPRCTAARPIQSDILIYIYIYINILR